MDITSYPCISCSSVSSLYLILCALMCSRFNFLLFGLKEAVLDSEQEEAVVVDECDDVGPGLGWISPHCSNVNSRWRKKIAIFENEMLNFKADIYYSVS